MKAFGAPDDVLEHAEKNQTEAEYGIDPDNWPAVELFCRLGTQFHWGAMGGASGLNYQSIDFVFGLYDVKDRREVFESLQIMERAALRVLNKKER